MSSMKTEWAIPAPVSSAAVSAIARANGIKHPLVAQVLRSRGLVGEDLAAYLSPDLSRLEDPGKLGNIEAAARVLEEAIRSERSIRVYTDYDGDGVTGGALMVSYLRSRGAKADFFVPLRESGYGVTRDGIDRMAADPHGIPEVMVTVDCGTSSRKEIDYLRGLGVNEVVVTDHHPPVAGKETQGIVVNPHRPGDAYPNKSLAGVGVAYKLISAMHGSQPTANLDLVAIGTITDVMRLTGENRAIVRAGLERLAHTKRPGLAALLAVSKIAEVPCPHGIGGTCRAVTAEQVAFAVGPAINAIGRMEVDPANAIDLMLTKDPAEAYRLARLLADTNELRKERTKKVVDEALAVIVPDAPVIVYQGEVFKGLAGLVANRLVSEFARPVIVIDQEGHGSARSFEDFDLKAALQTDFSDLVVAAGHGQAMGISGLTDIDELRLRIAAYDWPFEVGRRKIRVDAVCRLSDLSQELMTALKVLEPTGKGNEKALVAVSGAEVTAVRPFGKDGRHVLFDLIDSSGATREAKWFGHAQDAPAVGAVVDVAGRPSLQRDWRTGRDAVQIEVEDVRPTAERLAPTIS